MKENEENKELAIEALKFSLVLVVLIFLVHFYKAYTGLRLSYLGVYPREPDGLIGILTAPLVHGDWEHLFSNIFPLFMLSFVIRYFYKRIALISFILIYVLTGFMVWFLARPVYHIGASGVVYGLVSFVFWTGIFRRNVKSIVLALAVLVMYSGYFLGILPSKEGVSWESHLLGGIVGIIIAFIFKSHIEFDEMEKDDPWAHESLEDEYYFLHPETFHYTKAERAEMERRRREQEFLDSGQPF